VRRLEKTVETKQKVRIELTLDEDLARLLLYLSDKLQKPVEDIVFTALRLYVGKHITDIV
jgi:hypothetical protein